MPVARYFLYMGGVLLTLLFMLDWYLPPPTVEAARADVDRSTIRLQSAHKWPSAVVFDTTQPTIVPPVVAAVAPEPPPAASPAKSPLQALAMVQPKEPAAVRVAPPAARKRVVRRTTRIARAPAPAPRVASYDMFSFGTPFRMSW